MKGPNRLIALGALALALLVAGCTSAPGTNTTVNTTLPAADTSIVRSWQLVSYLGADGRTVDALGGAVPVVQFTRDGSVAGSVGCNRFSANYSVRGTGLTIGPTVSTLMYCASPAGVMDQEQRVFELFEVAGSYAVTGETLTISDRNGRRILTFIRAAPTPDAPLIGPTWRLAGFSDNTTSRSALAGTNATVTFSSDGRITGTTGCNDVQGSYTLSGNALRTGPLTVTERACAEPERMAQERDLLEALSVAATYEIEGDRLVLTDEGSRSTVEFVRMP
jgi:heat shock protein HslJ